LEKQATSDPDRLELAGALAYLDRHEAVYRLLSAVAEDELDEESAMRLGLAAANVGRPDEARRILEGRGQEEAELGAWLDGLLPGRYEALQGHFPYYSEGLLAPPGKWLAALEAIGLSKDLEGAVNEWLAAFPALLKGFELWLYWGDDEHPVLAADVLCASNLPEARSVVERWLTSG